MKKKNILFAIAIGAMGFTSCSLDQNGETDYTPQQVYENPDMTKERVYSLYGALTTDRTYAQDLAVTFCNNTDIECVDGMYTNKDGRRDNLASYRGWGNYYNSSLLADSKNYDMYNELFGIVGDANYTIEGVRNSNIYISGDAVQKQQMGAYLGEALTLRAVAYLDLIRLYGDVPMQFEPAKDDLSNVRVGKTNRDVILDKLIADLDEAAVLLPWAGDDGYTTEHVTKGYALALKAQLALTRAGWAIREGDMNVIYGGQFAGEYESEASADADYPTQRPVQAIRDTYYKIAAQACAEVIASEKHELNPSFKALWAGIDAAQETYNADSEIMFQIPFGLNKSGELGYSVGVRLENQTAEFGYTNSTGHMSLTAKLLYDYDKKDTRRDVTCCLTTITSTSGENYSKSGIRKDKFIGNKPFGIACGKWDPRNMSEQWRQVNLAAGGKFGYGINYIKMRYSQVLLMYAEAVNELQNDGIAYTGPISKYDALAKVRQRAITDATVAKKYDGAGYAAFFNALVDENELEFAGEGVRKYELVRWNLLCEKIRETKVSTQAAKNVNNGFVWDGKINYYYEAGTDNRIVNISTYTIGHQNATGEVIGKGTYDENKGFCGANKDGEVDVDNINDATYYCGGLVGCPTFDVKVKNRYILPLSNQTVSASAGLLSNSYGY